MDTRVTMVFSFVLWCLFESPIQCVRTLPENRQSLINLALCMQKVDTGYPDMPRTASFIRDSDIVSLREIILTKIDQLFCRYMTSVVNHMESTKTLFQRPIRNQQIECIASFNEVAKEMIGTLYGLGGQGIDGLMLFIMYVNELPNYFRSVTTGNEPMSVELAVELFHVHEKITRYLKGTITGRLSKDYEQSQSTSSESQPVDYLTNLDAIKTLMVKNRLQGYIPDSSYKNFTPSQLYLNDAVIDQQLMSGLQLLVSDLQIDLDPLYIRLAELNAKAHDFLLLSHGPRSIDAYHDLLFDFLELVILRFARKHIFLVLHDPDRQTASSLEFFFNCSDLYLADSLIMLRQTNKMTWLFRINSKWLKKYKRFLRTFYSTDTWKEMDTAGRQEEDRILKKHNLPKKIRVDLSPSVIKDTFQSVLKLASSRGIWLTDRAPDLEKDAISPVRMNIITMDVTYKYFMNILFRDIKFSLLDLFHRHKAQQDISDGNQVSTSR